MNLIHLSQTLNRALSLRGAVGDVAIQGFRTSLDCLTAFVMMGLFVESLSTGSGRAVARQFRIPEF